MAAQFSYFGDNLRAAGNPEYVELDHTSKSQEALNFERAMQSRVVGQDEAVQALTQAYQVYQAAMNMPGRPIATLLFLGPTGTGKTRTVEAAAETLFGSATAFIRVDCAEFQHSHEIAKLIGSPPGYLGHRETPPILTQEHINSYQTEHARLTLILFDEIEKASDSLWQLLLGVMDKATLTLGDNRRVDFSRTVIVMTSNLGAREMEKLTEIKLGFHVPSITPAEGTNHTAKVGVEAARRKFSPEFMNRIDRLVVFKRHSRTALEQILELELQSVERRVSATGGGRFSLKFTDRARGFLLREGTDPKYGARPLKRIIERSIVMPLSNLIATRQVREGDMLLVDMVHEEKMLRFLKQNTPAVLPERRHESPFARRLARQIA